MPKVINSKSLVEFDPTGRIWLLRSAKWADFCYNAQISVLLEEFREQTKLERYLARLGVVASLGPNHRCLRFLPTQISAESRLLEAAELVARGPTSDCHCSWNCCLCGEAVL